MNVYVKYLIEQDFRLNFKFKKVPIENLVIMRSVEKDKFKNKSRNIEAPNLVRIAGKMRSLTI